MASGANSFALLNEEEDEAPQLLERAAAQAKISADAKKGSEQLLVEKKQEQFHAPNGADGIRYTNDGSERIRFVDRRGNYRRVNQRRDYNGGSSGSGPRWNRNYGSFDERQRRINRGSVSENENENNGTGSDAVALDDWQQPRRRRRSDQGKMRDVAKETEAAEGDQERPLEKQGYRRFSPGIMNSANHDQSRNNDQRRRYQGSYVGIRARGKGANFQSNNGSGQGNKAVENQEPDSVPQDGAGEGSDIKRRSNQGQDGDINGSDVRRRENDSSDGNRRKADRNRGRYNGRGSKERDEDSSNRSQETEKKPKVITLTMQQYEKKLLEKRKGLEALNMTNEERVVNLGEEFESMKLIGKKLPEQEASVLKSQKANDGQKKGILTDKDKKGRKPTTMSVDEFMKPDKSERGIRRKIKRFQFGQQKTTSVEESKAPDDKESIALTPNVEDPIEFPVMQGAAFH